MHIILEGENSEDIEMRLMNELGVLLKTQTIVLENGWKKMALDLNPFPVGFYELQIIWNQHPRTYRIIKVDK